MEQITITIRTGNAAFTDYPVSETARILRDLAERLERDDIPPEKLMDINGNHVGEVTVA